MVALDGRVLPLGWADQLGLLEDDLLTSKKSKEGSTQHSFKVSQRIQSRFTTLHKNTKPIWVRQPSQAPTTARLQLGALRGLSQYR